MKTFSLRANDDGIIQIFEDGRYIAYIDEDQKLYAFGRDGYAELVATLTMSNEAGTKLAEWFKRSA